MSLGKIAIIGMSYRFPGTTPATFWADLLAGRDLVTRVAPDRWAADTFLHPSKANPGTTYSFAAGTLGDIAGFDTGFFGISPREAAQMDPQQRLLLELSWEALESAGIRPSTLRGSPCGVYVGISSVDYGMRMADDTGAIGSTMITGNTSSIAANRISYFLDLRGPSMALDTACSSSLVAFHQACRAIESGDASMALAGGVSLHLHPMAFVAFSKASMLSRTGRCRSFDAGGDGYVRSEGGGLFVLKAHEQAIADGDPIWAVVAGSQVNTDGKKSGLTVPSRSAQASLLSAAYGKAQIDPREIAYLEAHGTGTPVGDPIEATALGEALGRHRPAGEPLLIGSVKSNLGHLEAASGVAGLVKALHCLKHRMVPATLHVQTLNPNIDFDALHLRVVTANTALPATGCLTVGVNSFGFGGANAHVILQSPQERVVVLRPKATQHARTTALPLVVTAKTEAALRAAAAGMAKHLRNHAGLSLADLAGTAALHRDWHEHRAVAFGASQRSLALALESFAKGSPSADAVVYTTAMPQPVKVAFVYSGNGSQWEAMGRRLFKEEVVFKEAVLAVEQVFEKLADYSIEAELAGRTEPGRYARTEVAQPALFAVQVGITEMLRSRGVVPDMVAGHSVGEVAAAWAAGALTLEQAVQVIYHRSHLQGRTHGLGGMSAVAVGAARVEALLDRAGLQGQVNVATINSHEGVTLAGTVQGLDTLEPLLAAEGVLFKRLDLAYAFHGPLMDAIQDDLHQRLAGLRPRAHQLPFFSSVTGTELHGNALDAGYWWRNVRQPVLWDATVDALHSAGARLFVEIGPHPVLCRHIDGQLRRAPGRVGRSLPTLVRNDDGPQRVWEAALLVMLNVGPASARAYFPQPGQPVELPAYPWQKEALWHAVTPASHQLLHRRCVHPLLGYRLEQHNACWENQLDTQLQPMLADHVVGGAVVFPGAGFVELALAVAAQHQPGPQRPQWLELEELDIRAPLVLGGDMAKAVRVELDAADGSFNVTARDKFSTEPWALHACGRIRTEAQAAHSPGPTPQWPTRAPDFDGATHLQLAHALGLDYGPAFAAVEQGWVQGASVWARLQLPPGIAADLPQYLLHPALLDSAFQLLMHLLVEQASAHEAQAFVPVRIGRLSLNRDAGVPALAQATLVGATPHGLRACIELFDAQGQLCARVQDVRFRSIHLRHAESDHLSLLEIVGVPMPRGGPRCRAHAGVEPALQVALHEADALLRADPLLQTYGGRLAPRLDDLCTAFAVQALQRLLPDRAWLSDAQAHEWVEQAPQSAELLIWLLDLLEDQHILRRGESGWHVEPQAVHGDPAALWRALLAEHPEHFSIVLAVGRAGLHLADRLQARTPLPAGSAPGSTFLREIIGAEAWRGLGRVLARGAAQALAELAEGQRLHIVEFSASAPHFAGAVLRGTERARVQYLVVHAEEQLADAEAGRTPLADHPAVARAPLLLRPLPADDPRAGSFDLAIVVMDFASPALAAAALKQARQLLAPGGCLWVVQEAASRWQQWVAGGPMPAAEAPGAGDPDAAQPMVAAQLRQLGCTVMGTTAQANLATPTVLLARTPAHSAQQPAPAQPPAETGCWLLLVDGPAAPPPMAVALMTALQAQGRRCELWRPPAGAAAFSGAELQAGLAAHLAREPLAGVVVLPVVGHAPVLGEGPQTAHRCLLASGLVQACEALQQTLAAWFVTEEAARHLLPCRTARPVADTAGRLLGDAALWALVSTLRNEASCVTARLIDIERPQTGGAPGPALVQALVAELLQPDAETRVVLAASGARFVGRLRAVPRRLPSRDEPAQANNLRLSFHTAGQLRNLHWQSEPRRTPAKGEISIAVAATGLNFRDLMYALGMLSDEAVESGFSGPTLGLECAGVVDAVGPDVLGLAPGDHVVAFAAGCFGRQVITPASAAARLPGEMSLEAAATIPTTFFTAHYALVHLARTQPGERVLIHGAAGGVGLAAVQLAQHLGAEIHATAGSQPKRDLLRLMGVRHIYDSRSLSFADEILQATGGEGVDVVLNSLAGEAINRNLGILRPFGRFLELGKRDFYENTRIGLRPLRNNIAYFGVDADQLLVRQPRLANTLFAEVMSLFGRGLLHALPFVTFEADQVVDAFRHMQQARHIGKIVVTYHDDFQHVHQAQRKPPALRLQEQACYLVTGGLSGFGLRTAQWLATKGARHLVLVGRRGAETPDAQAAVTALEQAGVQVLVHACDVSDRAALQALLQTLQREGPPLRGVVHAAAVFEDAFVRQVTPQQFQQVFAPKALGAWHLHELTQGLALDFFLLYSSVTTAIGNPGQGAYVAANAVLEALAHQRRAAGLPALCVRWGAIRDSGYLARNTKLREALKARFGGQGMPAAHALGVLEELLLSNRSDLCVADLDWRTLRRFLPSATEPLFSEMVAAFTEVDGAEDEMLDLPRMLAEMGPRELQAAVGALLKSLIGEILRVAPERIDEHRSLLDLGLDSMMAVELAMAVEQRLGVKVPVMALSDSPTVAKIAERIITVLKGNTEPRSGATPESLQNQVQAIVDQHAVRVPAQTVAQFATDMQNSEGHRAQRLIR